MRKNLLLLTFLLSLTIYSFAQQKNSFAIGAAWPFISRPAPWRANSYELNFICRKIPEPWLGYYYKNKISGLIQFNYFEQRAFLKDDFPGSEFMMYREVLSLSAFAGYCFTHTKWKVKGRLENKIDYWIYAGASYYFRSYTTLGYMTSRTDIFKNVIRPSGMFMVKYNYAKCGFISLSGGYYYVSKHTQPFILGIGTGLQF